MISLSIAPIVNRFSAARPDCPVAALFSCRVSLRYLGHGVFREAYRVNGLPLIMKCPVPDSKWELGIQHSEDEVETLKKITASFDYFSLKDHLPEIYYCQDGIMLMREYKLVPSPLPPELRGKYSLLQRRVERIDYGGLDIDQLGLDSKGNLIVLDWGLVGEKRRKWNAGGFRCL